MRRAFFITMVCNFTAVAAITDALFDALAEQYGVHKRVRLFTPPGGERGLFTTEVIREGEPVLAVPASLLLVCRSDLSSEIQSPWDAPHHDAKDTLLARQLLAALEDGTESAEVLTSEQREFWRAWRPMLPVQGTLAHPLTLPNYLLPELHDDRLAEAALLQQARVDAVLAGMPPAAAGDAAATVKAQAQRRWAVAMCSSRPFSIPLPDAPDESPTDDDGTPPPTGLAAFVPFVDMANHADEPNCEVQGRGDGDGDGGGGAGGDLASAISVVGLVAKRDLEANEEASVPRGAHQCHRSPTRDSLAWVAGHADEGCAATAAQLPLRRHRCAGTAAMHNC